MKKTDIQSIQKSLTEIMLDQMLLELDEHELFHAKDIERLRELVKSGNISKSKLVVDVLKATDEEQ